MPVAIPVAGYVLAAEFTEYAAVIIISTAVVSGVVNAQEQRRQQRRAIEASRRDLTVMVRSAEAPHRVVYGQARISGPIAFTHSTGAENGNLYLIVCLTGHEIDSVVEIIFNEEKLGLVGGLTLFGSSFFTATLVEHRNVVTTAGTGVVTIVGTVYNLDASLKVTLPVAGVLAYVVDVRVGIVGSANFLRPLTFNIGGNVITVIDPIAFVGMQVLITWAEWTGNSLVDVISYTGTTTQAADGDTMGQSGGRWTSAHQLKGRAYIRARLIWNMDRFLAGVPNISARVRGRLVSDPRTLIAFSRDWADNLTTDQTLFGGTGAAQSASAGAFHLTSGSASAFATSRMDAATSFSTGNVQVTFTAPTTGLAGFVFRTTHWEDAEHTYNWVAYYDGATDNVVLARGSNSAAGTFTTLGSAASGVTAGNPVTLLAVIGEGTYTLSINGVLKLTVTTALKIIAGQVGLYVGGTSVTVDFDDLSINGGLALASWSDNSALCIRDYLMNEQFGWGATEEELDNDSFIAAANICDELITVDTTTIADPDEATRWLALLYQATIDGTWTAEVAGDFLFLANEIGSLTTHSGGLMFVDTSHATYAEDVLLVSNTSAAFSEYVNLPLSGMTDGNITLRAGYPTAVHAIGFTFRGSNDGVGDVFDGYRLQIDGTTGLIRLFRSVAGALTLIGSAAAASPGGSPLPIVAMKVTFSGPSFEVFYQGISKFTVTDGTYSSGLMRLLAYRNPPGSTGTLCGFADLTTQGTARVFRQKRYTCNGAFTVDRTPEDILSSMLTSCAGQISFTGGVFRLVVGAYVTPTLTLTEADMRGPVTVIPRRPRRELFNAVRGVYAAKSTFDQPTDFPPVTNATYEAQDGDEQISTDLELAFTNDQTAAQRIAKIHLEKHRQGISVQAPCTLKALALRPGDTVMLTLSRFGWSAKVFRVERWSLRLDEDYGVDLVLQEEAAANYDWDLGNATVDDPAPDTALGAANASRATDAALQIMMQDEQVEDWELMQ